MQTLKRTVPGLLLIVAAAAVLLLLDRPTGQSGQMPVIALFQHNSRPVLDESIAGVLQGLEAGGAIQNRDFRVQRFNADGDLPTANTIAKQIAEGNYRMVITASTPSLQAMASANRAGKVTHIFCTVTDPFGAGVGISAQGHPKHLAGIGTFQPVREAFRLARRMNPNLKRVGVVWCPSETCSTACLKEARDECAKLGIALEEAPVENTAGVGEAAAALTSRRVEALWIGGDNVVEACTPAVVKAAADAHIPVFANAPGHADSGSLFGLGADYIEVGKLAGRMAAEVLRGRDPATIEIKNQVPQKLAINLKTLATLGSGWSIPPDLRKTAAYIIDASGNKVGDSAATATRAAGRKWNIAVVDYVDSITTEDVWKGLGKGLAAAKLTAGRDFDLRHSCAQGDVATLSAMVDAAISSKADLIVVTATPALQVAINKVHDIPIVFTSVANGVLAGAGKSEKDHLPNITGVTTTSDFGQMIATIKLCTPGVRTVGTLYAPAEINSVFYRDLLSAAAEQAGMTCVSLPVTGTADVADAADALAGKVDAICQISDNVNNSSFAGIAKAATKAHKPLYGFASGAVTGGAALAVARDYEQAGMDGAALVARVMHGESPAGMPFRPVSRTVLVISRKNAAAQGVALPTQLVSRADKVVD